VLLRCASGCPLSDESTRFSQLKGRKELCCIKKKIKIWSLFQAEWGGFFLKAVWASLLFCDAKQP